MQTTETSPIGSGSSLECTECHRFPRIILEMGGSRRVSHLLLEMHTSQCVAHQKRWLNLWFHWCFGGVRKSDTESLALILTEMNGTSRTSHSSHGNQCRPLKLHPVAPEAHWIWRNATGFQELSWKWAGIDELHIFYWKCLLRSAWHLQKPWLNLWFH